MHGFKVAFRISGQVVNSPSEELLRMLMLLYADDLVLLAPSRSDLTLEELERITRKWGMMVNYPKTEAVVFGLPAATAASKIQVGSSSVAVKPHFKYVGSIVQADGGQDRDDGPPQRPRWPVTSYIYIIGVFSLVFLLFYRAHSLVYSVSLY